MHPYVNGVIEKISLALNTQIEKLDVIAEKLAKSVENGGVLHVLGSGHSHMLAEEIFYRAGGALFVNPILDPGLMLHNGPSKSTRIERLSGYAEAILEDIDFTKEDIFLIISNSGRNVLPIETAYYAREKGMSTISISSLAHSKSVKSRHVSGKRLFELTDYALDNYGEIGDAQLSAEGLDTKYGPTSSAVGVVLVQTWISMTIEKLVESGVKPPLLQSANLDDSDERNRNLIKDYMNRIPLLR